MYGIYRKSWHLFSHRQNGALRVEAGGSEGEGQHSQCVSLRRIKAAASEMHSNNDHIREREREMETERACLLLFSVVVAVVVCCLLHSGIVAVIVSVLVRLKQCPMHK